MKDEYERRVKSTEEGIRPKVKPSFSAGGGHILGSNMEQDQLPTRPMSRIQQTISTEDQGFESNHRLVQRPQTEMSPL